MMIATVGLIITVGASVAIYAWEKGYDKAMKEWEQADATISKIDKIIKGESQYE